MLQPSWNKDRGLCVYCVIALLSALAAEASLPRLLFFLIQKHRLLRYLHKYVSSAFTSWQTGYQHSHNFFQFYVITENKTVLLIHLFLRNTSQKLSCNKPKHWAVQTSQKTYCPTFQRNVGDINLDLAEHLSMWKAPWCA